VRPAWPLRADAYHRGVDHLRTLADLVRWAGSEENIRLVVLTGSLAREPGEADPMSDIDVELYVRQPDALLQARDWYRRFGEVVAVEELENEGWHPTRLVYFAGGKIDFMIASVTALDAGVSYRRGFRVLLDKDGLGGRLGAEAHRPTPPTTEEFRRCVDWFSAAAIMSAKAIARREPWSAKGRDRDLKDELLVMIEWDHRCRYGQDYDTWYQGGHMRQWMDADVQASLERCWAGFSLEETTDALEHSIRLFERLGARTADALGIDGFDLGRVRAEVDRLLRSSTPL
jgi:aminoglycoside 6-adenylyltransferase